ncbi:acyltransferase family protein [Cellulomonas hominis]|uniref:acyltransferase family protein n=1 Tax=Cellulomonas hominis TaxID=156981 RepID=UPI001B97140C|nr:acyltransferase [Cellulomonas hominis]VTR78131.1 O-acetyltransferase OatA [Cellulomonas hominis]
MTDTAHRAASSPASSLPPVPSGPQLPVLWSLNGLRAAGAVLVMLYHVNSWNLQVIRGSSAGYTGVGLFFVLSGFVLTWTARPGTTIGTFYARRLARIYPNHLVAFLLGVAVTVLVAGTALDVPTVLAGIFLVQAWSPDGEVVFAVNGVAWSLSCEIAFYLVFPLLLWGLRRMRAGTRAVAAGVALAVPPVIGLLWPGTIALLFHLPPSRLPEFVLGMVTAMAVQEGWRPRLPAPVLLGALAVGILGAARFEVHPTVLTAVLAAVFAPLAARCAWGDISGRNRWARHPVVMLGGALSFSFYLLHELVIKVLVATPVRGPVTIPVVLVVSAGLAFLLWRGVEIPVRAGIIAALPGTAPPRATIRHRPATGRPRHGRPRAVAWSFPVPTLPVPQLPEPPRPAAVPTAGPAAAAAADPAAPAAPAVDGGTSQRTRRRRVGPDVPPGAVTAPGGTVALPPGRQLTGAAPAGAPMAASAAMGMVAAVAVLGSGAHVGTSPTHPSSWQPVPAPAPRPRAAAEPPTSWRPPAPPSRRA